jgi:hypothetical protein
MYQTPRGMRVLAGNEALLIKRCGVSLGKWIKTKIEEEEKSLPKSEPKIILGSGAFCKIPFKQKLIYLSHVVNSCLVSEVTISLNILTNSTLEVMMAWILYQINEEIRWRGGRQMIGTSRILETGWRSVVYQIWADSRYYNPVIIGSVGEFCNIYSKWESVINLLARDLVHGQKSLEEQYLITESTDVVRFTEYTYNAAVKYILSLEDIC